MASVKKVSLSTTPPLCAGFYPSSPCLITQPLIKIKADPLRDFYAPVCFRAYCISKGESCQGFF